VTGPRGWRRDRHQQAGLFGVAGDEAKLSVGERPLGVHVGVPGQLQDIVGLVLVMELDLQFVIDIAEPFDATVFPHGNPLTGLDNLRLASPQVLKVVQLIIVAVLEGPVDVDATLVGKGVFADGRLVDGDGHPEGIRGVLGNLPGLAQVHAGVEQQGMDGPVAVAIRDGDQRRPAGEGRGPPAGAQRAA